jgi:hypothetical protein
MEMLCLYNQKVGYCCFVNMLIALVSGTKCKWARTACGGLCVAAKALSACGLGAAKHHAAVCGWITIFACFCRLSTC